MISEEQIIELIAKSIWGKRREHVARSGVDLEEWGDGKIPRLNGIFEEAKAAYDTIVEVTPEW